MARFDTTGLDEIVNQMRRMGQEEGPVAEEMVNAAVETIRDEWKKSAEAHGHIDTGAMIDSIGLGPGPNHAGNIIYRDVYPQGTDGKGVRNATKAFILNYGKHNMPASYWVNEADENSAGPVQDACQAIWDRFLQSGGG